MTVWRIEKDRHLGSAKTGEGARLYGGRWNTPGSPLVYASGNLSLAVLEVIVHSRGPDQQRAKRSKAKLNVPNSLVEALSPGRVPGNFGPRTPEAITQAIGDEWLAARRSPALLVPSAIVPEEHNLLVNPLHPQFEQCRWSDFASVELDPRIWSV